MARRMTSPVMVGRDDVLGRLSAVFDAARSGAPRHVVVGGEAGVGKTRLLAQARQLVEAQGGRVVTGACVAMGETGLPFAPYTEILRGLVASEGVATVAALAGRAAPDLSRLVPSLSPDVAPPAQELWAQTRMYEALLDLFRRLSERAPLVLQLEDLHWSDDGTLAATSYLMRAARDDAMTVMATFRTDEVSRKHPLRPWLAELARQPDVERIDLQPLGLDDLATLTRNILGDDLPRHELEEVHRRSDGNPFYAEELLCCRTEMGTSLPSTLKDVLLSRIDALPIPAQHLIGVAAVGGREVEHTTLVAVADRDDSTAALELRVLVDQGHLSPVQAVDGDDAYSFRHALLQEAVYDAMLPTERRRLHLGWAEVLREHGPDSAGGATHLLQLAHHWREARHPRAMEASIAAGDAAMAGFSYEIAMREYEQALLLWDDHPDGERSVDHAKLLERTAEASYLASHYRRAVTACREAIAELGDGDAARRTELLILLGRTLWVSGDWAASISAYERALRTAPAEPRVVRIRSLSGLGQVYMLHGRLREARSLCEEAIAGARAIGARDLEGHALNSLGVALMGLGEVAAAERSLDEALRIALELGIPDDIGRAFVNRAEIENEGGYPERALQTSIEGVAVAAEWGVVNSYGAYLGFAAASYGFESGAWHEASRMLAAADRNAITTEGTYVYRASYVLELMACRGDEAFEDLWKQARRLIVERPASDNHGLMYMAGIQAAALAGAHEQALAYAREVIEVIEHAELGYRLTEIARVAAWPVAELGIAARRAGDEAALQAAREEMARLEALTLRWRTDMIEPGGRFSEILAQAAAQVSAERERLEGEDLAERWADLAQRWAELGRPYRSAVARWREAEAAERAGDRAIAVTALRTAHGMAGELGARPLVAHLDLMARRLRVRLDSDARPAPGGARAAFGLTPRELEVLGEVAAGRTNREIAAALFISESTAGVHVSNILAKLGVATRTEAARAALDAGLVGR